MNRWIRHIFLVDDDPDDPRFFEEALGQLPTAFDVVTFDNGVSVIDRLLKTNEELPDVIFLDLNMPLMNGEECLANIRNEPKFAKIPIVIYSNFMDRSKVECLFEKGANHYLQKPTSFEGLKSALQKCLSFLETKNSESDGILNFVVK